MNASVIEKIFADTAYIRTGGSDEELKCAGGIYQKIYETQSGSQEVQQ